MALARVLSKSMSSTKVLNRLICCQPTRCFHDGFERFISTDDNPIENPFQVSGPKTSCTVFKDDDSGHHVRFDLPGVDRRLEVWAGKREDGGDMLIVSGISPYDIREKNDYHLMQRFHPLPDGEYQLEDVKARMKDGVLRVFVPLKNPLCSSKTE